MGKIVLQPPRPLVLTPVIPLTPKTTSSPATPLTPKTTSSPAVTTNVSNNKPRARGISIALIVVISLIFIGAALLTYYYWSVLLRLFGISK
jgi:hypothetical protein